MRIKAPERFQIVDEDITFKQLDYLIRLQDTEEKQKVVRNYLRSHKKQENITTLTKQEASELIDILLKIK